MTNCEILAPERMRGWSYQIIPTHIAKNMRVFADAWAHDRDELIAALERERQKDRQIADLREALCDLKEMATKCDDGQYIDYPGARSIFCRARSALAKANQSEPTEGTPEDSHDDDR